MPVLSRPATSCKPSGRLEADFKGFGFFLRGGGGGGLGFKGWGFRGLGLGVLGFKS